MKTVQTKAADIKKKWVVVDAEGRPGRLASQVAHVLRGKHKPSFAPYWDCGDYVIVTNAAKVKLTGEKASRRNTTTTRVTWAVSKNLVEEMLAKPEKVLTLAVKRMLLKNKLASQVLQNLKVFAGAEHLTRHRSRKTCQLDS